ncbi:MAG: hypothetical protein ACKN9T_14695 [Candidatus Methylumidiphilus sp.]
MADAGRRRPPAGHGGALAEAETCWNRFQNRPPGTPLLLKHRLNVEQFGGELPDSLRQEFHANILTANLAYVLAGLRLFRWLLRQAAQDPVQPKAATAVQVSLKLTALAVSPVAPTIAVCPGSLGRVSGAARGQTIDPSAHPTGLWICR